MKLLGLIALCFAAPSAFAAGDLPQTLTPHQAADLFVKYQDQASELGCTGWMATSGELTGGGLPGFRSETITLNIIQSKSPAKSVLTILKTRDELNKTRTLSFECKQL